MSWVFLVFFLPVFIFFVGYLIFELLLRVEINWH